MSLAVSCWCELLALDSGLHSVWDAHFSKFSYFTLLWSLSCISLGFAFVFFPVETTRILV